MTLELWAGLGAQLVVLLGALLRLESRLTRLESDMQWIMRRARGANDE